jgi:hypothetical protein
MPDFSKSQIYKIVHVGFNLCHIGSTVEKLHVRMVRHRSHYKSYLKGQHNYVSLFKIFDEYGVDNCKIYLIENYPCQSKEELTAREGEHQKNTECVNKRMEGRTMKQWCQDNKETISMKKKTYYQDKKPDLQKKNKEYYEDKKEDISLQRKERRKNNPELIREQERQAYQRNKEHKKSRRGERAECDCGAVVCRAELSRHRKTKKHHKQLQNQSNPQEQ